MNVYRCGKMIAAAALSLFLVVPAVAEAQDGQVTGTVTAQDGQPLASSQVTLENTGYTAITNAEGVYTLTDVAPGTYNLVVRRLGYAAGRQGNIQVRSGETTEINIQLSQQALRLQGLVVSGVTDPVEGTRMPFSASRITRESLPVPQTNMVDALRGRVAGARVVSASGQPGSGTSIRLRSRLGVNTSDAPLIVVDGIQQGTNLIDLDALDIESMEVLKGAAAASLYGSRAQAGVIEIRTRRGQEVAVGTTRITARTEYGTSFLGDVPMTADHHAFEVNEQGQYVDADGNPLTEPEQRTARVLRSDQMMVNPYPGQTFNHLELFFDPGQFTNTSVNVAQNMEGTNFFLAFADNRESGVAPEFNDGYHRQNFRANLDHQIRDDLSLSFTGYHSTSARQNLTGGNPFFTLRFIAPDIDLTRPNPDGQPFIIRPDPAAQEDSPLYALSAQESWNYRKRTQGSITMRYNPTGWLSVDGLFGYDRSDRENHRTRPQDFLTGDPDTRLDGLVQRSHNFSEDYNGYLQGNVIRTLGADMTFRTRARYNFSREEGSGFSASGSGYIVAGIPTFGNMEETSASGATFSNVREEGFLVNSMIDYRQTYLVDVLFRRDGSSLFGPDNRWSNYYRGSFSYTMTAEDWWPFESITEFKPRYSIGTAGSRPGFSWQYETWSVGVSGPAKGTLGNQALAPERTTEQDFGLDFIIKDRYSVELTYARARVEDQLVPVPLASFFGYSSQWQNVGEVESRAYEAQFEASLIQSGTTRWNMGLVMDRSRSWLSEWGRTCYTTSTFYRCPGESFSTMRLRKWVENPNELPIDLRDHADQFQVNDDGYMVPVGDANWTDGVSEGLWGTSVEIGDTSYDWGLPILMRDDETGQVDDLVEVGDANPAFNLGWTNNVNWRGFNLFTLVDVSYGGDAYNETRQWPYRDNMSPDMVQAGKPDELKKPLSYYSTLYSTNARNSHFVEDASFLKIRELSVGYGFDRSQLERVFGALGGIGMESLRINLIGRNLFTLTNYTGLDPEVGSGGAGGATENPLDSFSYPNFRQLTFSIEASF